MPSKILSSEGAKTSLTITLASLADGGGRQSARITDTTPNETDTRFFVEVTTGTTPTADSMIEFYLSRADTETTERSAGGCGASDAAYSNSKGELEFLRALKVDATSDKTYELEIIAKDVGSAYCIVVFNETGASLNATGSNHVVEYRTESKEGQ